MTVLFLDVDGVLVHSESIAGGRASGEPSGSSFFYAAQVDPVCAVRLFRLCEATGAKLVLCSAWRRFDVQVTGLRRALIRAGFPRRQTLFGSTPHHGGLVDGPERRAAECRAWVEEETEVQARGNPGGGPILAFVLDDGFVPGFLQLDDRPRYFEGGLRDEHVEAAMALIQAAVATAAAEAE